MEGLRKNKMNKTEEKQEALWEKGLAVVKDSKWIEDELECTAEELGKYLEELYETA